VAAGIEAVVGVEWVRWYRVFLLIDVHSFSLLADRSVTDCGPVRPLWAAWTDRFQPWMSVTHSEWPMNTSNADPQSPKTADGLWILPGTLP